MIYLTKELCEQALMGGLLLGGGVGRCVSKFNRVRGGGHFISLNSLSLIKAQPPSM